MCKDDHYLSESDANSDNCLNCKFVEGGFAKGVPIWHCRNNAKGEKISVNRRSVCDKYKSSW